MEAQPNTQKNAPMKCLKSQNQPCFAYAWRSLMSSSFDQPPRTMRLGSRWFSHLSIHCLPLLPQIFFAISDHFVTPELTHCKMTRSSSAVKIVELAIFIDGGGGGWKEAAKTQKKETSSGGFSQIQTLSFIPKKKMEYYQSQTENSPLRKLVLCGKKRE